MQRLIFKLFTQRWLSLAIALFLYTIQPQRLITEKIMLHKRRNLTNQKHCFLVTMHILINTV